MPTVPQYELGQVQSSGVNGMQNINAPADAFGANVARAQQGMGQEISRQAEIMFQREQKVQQAYEKGVLRELDNNLSSYIREKLIHPEAGFMTLTGRNAMSAKGALVENINEYRKSLEKDLNPRMLNNWSTMADSRVNSANNTISDHVMRETINYNKVESEVRVAGTLEDIKLSYNNVADIQKYMAVGLIEIDSQLMDEFGIDVNSPRDEGEQEIIANAYLKFTTQAHTSVIDSLIADHKSGLAKEYFEANQEDISQEVQDKIKKVLDSETLKEESQRATDEIMQAGGTIDEQIDKALAIEDATLRDEVLTRVTKRQTLEAAEITRAEKAAYDEVKLMVSKGTAMDDIPPELWEVLSDEDEATIRSAYATADTALREAIEKQKVEDKKLIARQLYFAFDKVAHDNYELFSVIPLQNFAGIIDDANLKSLIKKQREGPTTSNILGNADLIKMTFAIAGLDYSKYGDPDEKYEPERNFLTAIEVRRDRFIANNNREPNENEFQQILFEVATNFVTFDGEQVPIASLTAEDLEDAFVMVGDEKVVMSEIKDVHMAVITKVLENNGDPINARSIAEMWLSDQQNLYNENTKTNISSDEQAEQLADDAEDSGAVDIGWGDGDIDNIEKLKALSAEHIEALLQQETWSDKDRQTLETLLAEKLSGEVSSIDDTEKTYAQKQKEQDQKDYEYAKQNRKLKLKQTTSGKPEDTAYLVVQSNTRKIMSFIKGDGSDPKTELGLINEYLSYTGNDHPWDVLFNEADTNISAGLMRDLKKSQVKKLTKRKEAILKAHPEWKDKVKKDLVDAADNKILTDISGMKTKAQVNALKSHTDNILKQINWQAKAPKNITPSQEVKLMREELKLIKQYFAAANDEETHPWDEIFSSTYEFLSTSNSTSDADNEANEMIIELADEYLDMQEDILADRKKELQKALQ